MGTYCRLLNYIHDLRFWCMKTFLELQVCVFIYFITSYTFQFISGDIMQNKYAEEERPVSFSIKKWGNEIV